MCLVELAKGRGEAEGRGEENGIDLGLYGRYLNL
jgi:hypothetical protein